ncbi:MAG: hypothetical protein M3253_06340, partial [Chloroflexota bacterium]|nr:hypothetical protein [Chloroflexota bacterium]
PTPLTATAAQPTPPTGQPTPATGQPAPATDPPDATEQPVSGSPSPGPLLPAGWRELAGVGDGPSAREDHTWTVTSDGEAAYLFGGRARNDASDELWRYELATDSWRLLEPTGGPPDARFGHVAAWVDGVGLVVWSGQAGPRFFADVWAYDPATDAWQELPSSGDAPAARYGSCGAIGPDGRLWISHGFTADSGRFADTRAYDFAAGTWSDESPSGPTPVERCLHDCLWTPDGRLLIYAGQTTGAPAIGDMWTYDPRSAAWIKADKPEPEPRQLYSLAVADSAAFVFGGVSAGGEALDDLWQLDLRSLKWSPAPELLDGGRPSGRSGATLIADPARDRLLLLGGKNGQAELDDLWQLELAAPR